MQHAIDYFKAYPAQGVRMERDPLLIYDKDEYLKFVEKASKSATTDQEKKIVERTIYFNKLYQQANLFQLHNYFPKDDKFEIISKCDKNELIQNPLYIKNFSSKKYVEMTCEGLKKHIIKSFNTSNSF